MLPGYQVIFREGGIPRSGGGAADQGFGVAEAERGPTEPTLVTSYTQLLGLYGARQSYSFLHDCAETALTIGTRNLWVARVTGPAAARASVNLSDGTGTTLRVEAKWLGAYGNGLSVQVMTTTDDASIPAGSFKVRVSEAGAVVEDSPVFADKTEALAWTAASALTVRLVDQAGTGDPSRVAATPLVGGADDRAGITETQWIAALNSFTGDLGPGQVAGWGRTTPAWHLAVLDHCRLRNRHGVLDATDTATVATVTGQAVAGQAAPSMGGRFGSLYWPWAKIPGVNGIGQRTVPWSAVQMGLFSLADREAGPGQAAAGEEYGFHQFVDGITQDTKSLTDAQLEALNDAGVNVVRTFYGLPAPVNYGNRTLRSAASDPLWADASGSRVMMQIAAEGGSILRRWVHKRVDGKGVSLGQLRSNLGAMLAGYFTAGALYGETFDEAAAVDTGDQVNTPESLQGGYVRAMIEARVSPNPARAVLELVRVPITGAV